MGPTRQVTQVCILAAVLLLCASCSATSGTRANKNRLYEAYTEQKKAVVEQEGLQREQALEDLKCTVDAMFEDLRYGFSARNMAVLSDVDQHFVDCLYAAVMADEMHILSALEADPQHDPSLAQCLARRIDTVARCYPVSHPTLFAERAHFLVFLCRASHHLDRSVLDRVFDQNEGRWTEEDRLPMLFFRSSWGNADAQNELAGLVGKDVSSLRVIFSIHSRSRGQAEASPK